MKMGNGHYKPFPFNHFHSRLIFLTAIAYCATKKAILNLED